jgi:hypothetical protein
MGAIAIVNDIGSTPVMTEADCDTARRLSLRGVRPPVKVPGYENEQFLGYGAYGEVWTATNRNSGRRVAIKYFTRRGGVDWASLAREVEKLRYLFSDRYVVQLLEVGWEADPPFYVMEYMENGSLEDRLQKAPLSVDEAVAIFREVAIALVHAHDKGILHCDLKPANILLDHHHKPRLADFGQSRLTNEMSPALGTLFYMAPEQADLRATPDARWDVYALGAVMYRMLTGTPPHRNEPGATQLTAAGSLEAQLTAYRQFILNAPKPQDHRAVPGVDAGLAAIIDRCLETNPNKRFPNPQAVLVALDAWSLQRVRKPLLWVTGLTFAWVFVALALLGQYLFRTTVNTAKQGVVHGTREGNRFAALSEAKQIAAQIQLRWLQLEAASRSAQLRELLAHGGAFATDEKLGRQLDQFLAQRKERGDTQFPEGEKSALWFAHTADGYQRGSAPTSEFGRNVYRGYRDYFHGLGEQRPTDPPPPGIIQKPHRSVPYRRDRPDDKGIWSVAFTVPVFSDEPVPQPLGIVGMTITLANLPTDHTDRYTVLVDTRPDAKHGRRGLILRHPYWATMREEPNPPLYYAEEVVKWADQARERNNDDLPFEAGERYIDPVSVSTDGVPGQSEYAGEWLASVHRVLVGPEQIDTGWVVLVQERRDVALQPVRDLQWRLGYVGLGATVIVAVLMVLMWAGMIVVMDSTPRSPVSRWLRRWAGLSSGNSGGTLTASLTPRGNSLAGANTPRKSAAPTSGTSAHSPGPAR